MSSKNRENGNIEVKKSYLKGCGLFLLACFYGLAVLCSSGWLLIQLAWLVENPVANVPEAEFFKGKAVSTRDWSYKEYGDVLEIRDSDVNGRADGLWDEDSPKWLAPEMMDKAHFDTKVMSEEMIALASQCLETQSKLGILIAQGNRKIDLRNNADTEYFRKNPVWWIYLVNRCAAFILATFCIMLIYIGVDEIRGSCCMPTWWEKIRRVIGFVILIPVTTALLYFSLITPILRFWW